MAGTAARTNQLPKAKFNSYCIIYFVYQFRLQTGYESSSRICTKYANVTVQAKYRICIFSVPNSIAAETFCLIFAFTGPSKAKCVIRPRRFKQRKCQHLLCLLVLCTVYSVAFYKQLNFRRAYFLLDRRRIDVQQKSETFGAFERKTVFTCVNNGVRN